MIIDFYYLQLGMENNYSCKAERFKLSNITLTPIIYLQFGQSAMMVASWEGHLGIVEALISAEADPNLQDGVINSLCM